MRSHLTCRYRALGRTAVCSLLSPAEDSELEHTSAVLQGLVNSGAYYQGPIAQSPCLCNTVMYSLTEACQLCQYNVPDNVLQ